VCAYVCALTITYMRKKCASHTYTITYAHTGQRLECHNACVAEKETSESADRKREAWGRGSKAQLRRLNTFLYGIRREKDKNPEILRLS